MTFDVRLRSAVAGFPLPHPIICGAGEHVMTVAAIRAALAAGVAGVVAKSINESKEAADQLQLADYAVLDTDHTVVAGDAPRDKTALDSAFFCRSGLAGYPAEEWFTQLADLDREARGSGQFVAASIVLGKSDMAAELARHAEQRGLRVLELNIGAPHAGEARAGAITAETNEGSIARTVASVRQQFSGALWVKLTGLSENVEAGARAARDGGADAVVLAGRFMALVPDVETLRPMLRTSCAYGGRWALPITCRRLALTRRDLGRAFPLIGTNGARTGLDVARMLLAGASAVEMTSAVFLEGYSALTRAREELQAWLERKNLAVTGIVGMAADALESYGDQPARPGRWRDFVPPEAR